MSGSIVNSEKHFSIITHYLLYLWKKYKKLRLCVYVYTHVYSYVCIHVHKTVSERILTKILTMVISGGGERS